MKSFFFRGRIARNKIFGILDNTLVLLRERRAPRRKIYDKFVKNSEVIVIKRWTDQDGRDWRREVTYTYLRWGVTLLGENFSLWYSPLSKCDNRKGTDTGIVNIEVGGYRIWVSETAVTYTGRWAHKRKFDHDGKIFEELVGILLPAYRQEKPIKKVKVGPESPTLPPHEDVSF